jgi:hypothetical protein
MKYPTLLDACCSLIKRGFRWDADYNRFVRGSWHCRLILQNNGKCRTVSF